MDRKLQRAIEKLNRKAIEAERNHDFIKALNYRKEAQKLTKPVLVRQRTTLNEAVSNCSCEDKQKFTLQIIEAVVVSDLLNEVVMESEAQMKKIGIINVDMLMEMRSISKRLASIVKTIDDLRDERFSDNYMEMVDLIEQNTLPKLKEYIGKIVFSK